MKRDFYTKLFLVVAICSTTYKSFGLSSEKNELELRAERESFKIYEYYKNNPEYFDFDLRKYRTSKRKAIIGAGFFSINIGVTIILAMAASPIIFSPIANGVRTTTRTLKKYISNKKIKYLLKGSFLYLDKVLSESIIEKNRYLDSFEKFCLKLRQSQSHLSKSQDITNLNIAVLILNTNHFHPFILYRLEHDPTLYDVKKENYVFKKGSVKKISSSTLSGKADILNKILFELLSQHSFEDLNKILYGQSLNNDSQMLNKSSLPTKYSRLRLIF